MNICEKAKSLAKIVHEGQKYGKQDYVDYHISGVVDNLYHNYQSTYLPKTALPFWYNDPETRDCVVAAAWLHDSIEDSDASTPLTKEEVRQAIIDKFPPIVLDLVEGMTKKPNQSYSEYIFSILDGPICCPLAAIKLADLDFNISQSESRSLNGYEKQRLEKYCLARYILLP